jgi:DNA-binding MarR family transcriptional regulator
VERTPHPTDPRSKIVTATPAGAAAAAEAERILGTPPTALRELDEDDLAVLQRVMTKLER